MTTKIKFQDYDLTIEHQVGQEEKVKNIDVSTLELKFADSKDYASNKNIKSLFESYSDLNKKIEVIESILANDLEKVSAKKLWLIAHPNVNGSLKNLFVPVVEIKKNNKQ